MGFKTRTCQCAEVVGCFCFRTKASATSITLNTRSRQCPTRLADQHSQGCFSRFCKKKSLFCQGMCAKHTLSAPNSFVWGWMNMEGPQEPPAPQSRGLYHWTVLQFVTLPRLTPLCPWVNLQEPSHGERMDWRGLQEYNEYTKIKISRKCLLLWKTRCLNTDLQPCCHLPAGRLSAG